MVDLIKSVLILIEFYLLSQSVGLYQAWLVNRVCLWRCISCIFLVFFNFFEVLPYILDRLFIHGHSLFQNMKGSRNNIELAHNFFQGLCQFFTRACLLVVMLLISIQVLVRWNNHSSLSSQRSLGISVLMLAGNVPVRSRRLRVNLLLFGSKTLISSSSLWSIANVYTFSVRSDSTLASLRYISYCWATEVINNFLLLIIEVTFPHHHNLVSTCWTEVITARRKINTVTWSFMPIKSV